MQSFWASTTMVEKEPDGMDGGSLDDSPLRDHISHWVDVLDRWVKRVDLGMGALDWDVAQADSDVLGVGDPGLRLDGGVDLSKGVEG